MREVTIEKIYATHIWVERDLMGSNHIMIQHEVADKPFCYMSLHYDYAYTSNSTMHNVTELIMKQVFGIEKEDIVWKSREWK